MRTIGAYIAARLRTRATITLPARRSESGVITVEYALGFLLFVGVLIAAVALLDEPISALFSDSIDDLNTP